MSDAVHAMNIQNADDLIRSGLKPGDRVHIVVVGNHVRDDAIFTGGYENPNDPSTLAGVRVCIDGYVIPDLWWGDIIELWKLP